jgi:hypothetical protein
MYHDPSFTPGTPGSNPFAFGPSRQPPTEAVRSCAELKLWLQFAKPNEERRYAAGVVLRDVCRPELREYVMRLAELGFLTPHCMRASDGVPVYLVKRTRRALLVGQL